MTVENTTAPVAETTDAPNDPVADPGDPGRPKARR